MNWTIFLFFLCKFLFLWHFFGFCKNYFSSSSLSSAVILRNSLSDRLNHTFYVNCISCILKPHFSVLLLFLLFIIIRSDLKKFFERPIELLVAQLPIIDWTIFLFLCKLSFLIYCKMHSSLSCVAQFSKTFTLDSARTISPPLHYHLQWFWGTLWAID